jgi:protein O-mannosyl-transferase
MAKKKQDKSKNISPQYKEQKPLIQAVEQPKSAFFKENWLPIAIIVFFSIGLYIQTVTFDYALDDTMVIVKNKFTQRGFNGIGDIFKYESFRGYFGEQKQLLEGDRYRPLSIATFAAEQSLFGGNKVVSHFINILLYALTGVMLFRVLLLMQQNTAPQLPKGETAPLPSNGLARKSPFGGRGAWAAMATLLFIVHPLHVEVVANIKGRDDIIAFMGEMAALYFTFKYLNDNKFKYLIYSFLSFCVGILSKESAITFLAIVPLTAHFFTTATFSQKVKVTLPIIVATVFYLILRVNAIGYLLSGKEITDLMNNPFFGMTFGEKTATIFYTLLMYLKLHIFPHPLTHDYYPYQIPKMTWSDWQALLSLAVNIGLLAVILRGWKKRSIYAYAAAFYLVTLSIVSNLFVSVGTFMNERFAYHASLGFCIAVAYFLNEKSSNTEGGKKIAMSIFSLLIIGFSIKTLTRVPDWYSGNTLNNSAIKYSPNSARANCFYAVSMWENTYNQLPNETPETRKREVLDSMKFYFDKSVSILPKYGAAQKMRAAVASEYHKLDGNIEALIKVFDEVNRSGTYDAYVVEYLKYITSKVKSKADAENLAAFYTSMIVFYKQNYSTTSLPAEYTNLLADIQVRMVNLQ